MARERHILSDEEVAKLLELAADADSAELKVTVPEAHQRSAVNALGLDPLDAQVRQVYFYDTPDLALNRSGVVVRARRIQGRMGDSVVKLRPVVPADLPRQLRESPRMVVEVDAMPGGYVCSASLKGRADSTEVKNVADGRQRAHKLFTKEQRTFLAAHAPDGVELKSLSVLGPIFVLKLNSTPEGFGRRLTAEMWFFPDATRILELSTKCAPSEMFQVAAEARAYLARRQVDLSGEQQTKTKKALTYFSAQL